MTELKDVYPLYLNNEAAQPNTDLEVTDKYTNEVAFRMALVSADSRNGLTSSPTRFASKRANPSRMRKAKPAG